MQAETGHVFGIILHVARDLDNGSDWPLVVIDKHGHRESIIMTTDSMVIFESSTVIHGRPSPLEGDYYINSFFYYKPLRGWDDTNIASIIHEQLGRVGQVYYNGNVRDEL